MGRTLGKKDKKKKQKTEVSQSVFMMRTSMKPRNRRNVLAKVEKGAQKQAD